jgi:transposase
MLYLAIDQHRKQLTVNLRDESGTVILKRQVSTTWEKVRTFFQELRCQSEPAGGFVTILEVCGFNDWLVKMLSEYGCRELVLVQAAARDRQKTDCRDANALGELLWVNRHRLLAGQRVQGLKRIVPPEPRDAENRQLTARRRQLGQLRTRTVNRLHHLLLKHNLHQEYPTRTLDTHQGKKWLAELPLSSLDRVELDQLLEEWALHSRHIEQLEREIQRRCEQDERVQRIATIPGAAHYSSLSLASRVGDIKRFPTPASLANYWGLTPGCRNSGEQNRRLGSITKQGSALARFILGQLTLHVLRRDRLMKDWYLRIKRRRGSKIARVAVIIWHMLQHEEAYDPLITKKKNQTFARTQ